MEKSVTASGGRVYYFKDIIDLLLLTKTKAKYEKTITYVGLGLAW